MKAAFALVAIFVGVAVAAPVEQTVSVSQDTLGNYKLDVNVEDIARSEHRGADGSLTGSYEYVDKEGLLRRVDYTSGIHGYQASGESLPVPVAETPEVAEARAQHLRILHEESARAAREGPFVEEPSYVEPAPTFFQPAPAPSGIFSSPEDLRQAREQHFAAVDAALQQHRSAFL